MPKPGSFSSEGCGKNRYQTEALHIRNAKETPKLTPPLTPFFYNICRSQSIPLMCKGRLVVIYGDIMSHKPDTHLSHTKNLTQTQNSHQTFLSRFTCAQCFCGILRISHSSLPKLKIFDHRKLLKLWKV